MQVELRDKVCIIDKPNTCYIVTYIDGDKIHLLREKDEIVVIAHKSTLDFYEKRERRGVNRLH